MEETIAVSSARTAMEVIYCWNVTHMRHGNAVHYVLEVLASQPYMPGTYHK